MIRMAQCEHDGSFLVITWDLGILWVDNLLDGRDERDRFYFQEPIHMEKWIGFIGGIFYEGWNEFSQYLIALLIDGL